jgi:hypothetical protein
MKEDTMSKLTLVEEATAEDTDLALTPPVLPEGKLARITSSWHSLRARIQSVPSVPHLKQIRGVKGYSWFGALLLTTLGLNIYVSPLITELAMTTLIAPIAALALVILGEFDFAKLTSLIGSNAGIILATGGGVIVALFLQNMQKCALLIQSFVGESHRSLRIHALAGLFAPLTTATLWFGLSKAGYFMGVKSVVIGVLGIFVSTGTSQALSGMDIANLDTAALANLAQVMSNGLRVGLGILIVAHLWFVWQSYKLIHKTLEVILEKSVGWLKSLGRLIWAWPRTSIVGTVALGIVSLVILVSPGFLFLVIPWLLGVITVGDSYETSQKKKKKDGPS